MSCPHGEWHEKDCEICQSIDDAFDAGRNLGKARIAELEAENNRLKRCGNCDHNGGTHCCHPAIMESGEYIQTGNGGRMNECHFTPSLWAERSTT